MQLLKGDAVTDLAESTWRRSGVFAQNLSKPNEKNAAVQVGTERRPWVFLSWPFLGGGFKYFLFSPRKLGKIPILTTIFQLG